MAQHTLELLWFHLAPDVSPRDHQVLSKGQLLPLPSPSDQNLTRTNEANVPLTFHTQLMWALIVPSGLWCPFQKGTSLL